VVSPWGWVNYTVDLDQPDLQLRAVGVVQPGRRDLQRSADAQDELPVAARAALTGATGVAAGVAVAGDLQWPGFLRGLLTAVAVNAPQLVAVVRAGATFRHGKLVERSDGDTDVKAVA